MSEKEFILSAIERDRGSEGMELTSYSLELVLDMLESQIEYTRRTEPYATNWIQRAEIAREIILSLQSTLD